MPMMKKYIKLFGVMLAITFFSVTVYTQSPTRVGTTAAEFLSIGYGPAGCSVGDAYVSLVNDITSVYWNPAGLSFMNQSEAVFSYQPWLVDINTFFTGAGVVIPNYGTLAISLIGVNYGEMNVTTVDMQQGTGETFNASDYAFSLSYGRKLVTWFGFGASLKYINSSIWHSSADAFAVDLGVMIHTPFFSPTGSEQHGLKIGMSLANYGTKMQYNGIDLIRSVDIAPSEAGNFKDTKVNYATDEWDLPIIFRVGMSIHPIATSRQQLTLAADALHVNNNSESVNLGAEYMFSAPGVGKFFLRGGYRAIFLNDSEFGPTFGFGVMKQFFGNVGVKFDYAYRDIGLLGYVNTFGMNVLF
jgi:hypothetical protein